MEIVPDDAWTENDDVPLFVDGEMCFGGRTFWEQQLSHELESGRKKGQVWYLVNMTWYEQFESFMISEEQRSKHGDFSHPGKISNYELVDRGRLLDRGVDFPGEPDWQHDLKPTISEEDYIAVPERIWAWLHKAFGGGPCIPRYCLETGRDNEVFDIPITLYVLWGAKHAKLRLPRSLSFDSFQTAAENALKLTPEERKRCHVVTDNMVDLTAQVEESTSEEPETLDSLNVADNASLEFTADYGNLTNPAKSDVIPLGPAREPMQFDLTKNSSAPKSLLAGSSALRRPILCPVRAVEDSVVSCRGRVAGLAGLQNLGNTCFMNSALQCLFHCVPVLSTFLSGAFNVDLNVDNPLGKGGEMATAFGSLLHKIWRGDVDYVNPEGFKNILGKHAVQFQSYDQHDSQEFLSYLLDMLHEDLNRVKKKPYIEEADDEGRPDEEVAKESWDTYRARNDSAIVDHFQGLLKSTLDCPNCGHHKRKFDPFMYLSVPLPGEDTVLREVTVVPMDGVLKPQLYCARVVKNDTVGAFIEAMAVLLGISAEGARTRLTAASVSSGNKVVVLDDMSADLPHKTRWSSDKLVVYLYPEVEGPAAEGQPSKRAVIMPPGASFGSRSPLPLLLRVPENAIELESESTVGSVTMYRSSNKRYLLRPDCELARRVEDLLKPFKRLRSGSNLVYSPTASSPGQEAEESEMDEGGGADAGAGAAGERASGQGAASASTDRHSPSALAAGAARVLDADGDSPMISADTEATAHGAPRNSAGGRGHSGIREGPCHPPPPSDAMAAVDGVASETGAVSIESPAKQAGETVEGTPSWLMDTCSAGSGGAGTVANAAVDSRLDIVQGIPADDVIEGTPCSPGPVTGLLGGHESDTSAAAVTAFPPVAPPPPTRADLVQASRSEHNQNSILGPVPEPASIDMGTSSATEPTAQAADGGTAPPPQEAADGDANAQGGGKPAVRLMVVTEAGFEVGTAPQADADTRFFKLDVPARDAVDLFDVDAMSQVGRHDSVAQLDVRNEYTLEDCIKGYLASEVLGPRDTWHCPKCRQDVRAKKALDLWCLPEVLIIHLKRFSYSGSGYYATMSSKIDNFVEFPLQGLDMTKFVHAGNDKEAIYDCFGVSNHFGSVSGGHYTAYCAHERSVCSDGQKSGEWNCYNDRQVAATTPSAVVTSSAYVLFYRRRSKSEADPMNLVQQCKDQLQKEYPAQAAEARGGGPAEAPRASSPSTSTDVTEARAPREALVDSSPVQPAVEAAVSPPRLVDERMSGGEPNTPEPHTIALEHPTPITSSQSDDVVPPPEEAEMKTFGMSTSVSMHAGVPSAASAEKDVASDLFADVSDTGDAPASGERMQLSVYSQGIATTSDDGEGALKGSAGSDDEDPVVVGRQGDDRVHAWLQQNEYNDQ